MINKENKPRKQSDPVPFYFFYRNLIFIDLLLTKYWYYVRVCVLLEALSPHTMISSLYSAKRPIHLKFVESKKKFKKG